MVLLVAVRAKIKRRFTCIGGNSTGSTGPFLKVHCRFYSSSTWRPTASWKAQPFFQCYCRQHIWNCNSTCSAVSGQHRPPPGHDHWVPILPTWIHLPIWLRWSRNMPLWNAHNEGDSAMQKIRTQISLVLSCKKTTELDTCHPMTRTAVMDRSSSVRPVHQGTVRHNKPPFLIATLSSY